MQLRRFLVLATVLFLCGTLAMVAVLDAASRDDVTLGRDKDHLARRIRPPPQDQPLPPPPPTFVRKADAPDSPAPPLRIDTPPLDLPPPVENVPPKENPPPPPAVAKASLAKTSSACSYSQTLLSGTDQSSDDSVRPVTVSMPSVYEELAFANVDGGVWKQGWDVKYTKADATGSKLNVFVVPHSHNDPGWIKTLQQYFDSQTHPILDTIVKYLTAKATRKFIWAEMSYLSMWWDVTTQEKREQMRALVKSGQLEIVTGGWVMNDEANSHYYAIVDHLTEGRMWLKKHLPEATVRNGWAIDPFGHSPTMAYINRNSGLTSMLIQRTHYEVKKHLARAQNLEFMWRPLTHPTSSAHDMFTHMMPFYSYDQPHTCGPDPAVCCEFDFDRLPGRRNKCPWKQSRVQTITSSNVAERAKILIDQYRKKSTLYRSHVVLIPLGDDFRWMSDSEATAQFDNYERLFTHINSNAQLNANIQWGTLKSYFDAVRAANNLPADAHHLPAPYPVLSGDFFTYSDRMQDYWSGYFASRSFWKNLDRELESTLRAGEILFSLARVRRASNALVAKHSETLETGRRALGLFQHHDGITGTAKSPVVVDYGRRLHTSLEALRSMMSDLVASMLGSASTSFQSTMQMERQDWLQSERVITVLPADVAVFNSRADAVPLVVSVVVPGVDLCVWDGDEVVMAQVEPIWAQTGQLDQNRVRLVFSLSMDALSIRVVRVGNCASDGKGTSLAKVDVFGATAPTGVRTDLERVGFAGATATASSPSADISIHNEAVTAIFDAQSSLLKSLDGVTVTESFAAYTSTKEGGAYLFMPNGDASPVIGAQVKPMTVVTVGPIRSLCSVFYGSGPVQHRDAVLASDSEAALEMHTLVSLTSATPNRELVVRYDSAIDNQGMMYTDSNGLSLVRRHTQSKLTTQGNVFPMTAHAVVQDAQQRLTVHTRQPVGVSSQRNGRVELLVERRLLQDDNRGLGQAVLDNAPTRVAFSLLVERSTRPLSNQPPTALLSLAAHAAAARLNHRPALFFAPHASTPLPSSLTALSKPFPCDIHLVNLKSFDVDLPKSSALYLLRLGIDCAFGTLTCFTQSQIGFTVSSYFNTDIVTVKSTKPALLTLTEATGGGDMYLSLQPTELKAWFVDFE